MLLHDEILKLINLHQEGAYWDFKKQWYGKDKKQEQLIDIICMANNLENRDAYIIVGIDEEHDYTVCDVSKDANRRNTQMLTDFLRSKRFAGDYRPVVTVEPMYLGTGWIDIIVVHNSLNTPFFLKERFNSVNANTIYVRLQDSNTPYNQSADFHHIEYLWKKRFGMLLSPLEKVRSYLQSPKDWEDSPAQDEKKYYKYAPEYTIEHTYEPDDHRNGYEYYLFAQEDSTPHWCDIRIYYHQTILAELGGVILDGGRGITSTPHTEGFSLTCYSHWDVAYKYMVKGDLNHLIHEFYYKDDGDEERHAHNEFERCILIFENNSEHVAFKAFARSNWNRKEEYMESMPNFIIPYMEQIDDYNMDVFAEEFRNVQILRKMLDDFRKQQ